MNQEHSLMQDSFLESKEVINDLFSYMNAPEDWFIKHMTFDELLVALHRLRYLYGGKYPGGGHIEYIIDTYDGTATEEDIIVNQVAYVKGKRLVGTMPVHDIGDIVLDLNYINQNIEKGFHHPASVKIEPEEEKEITPSIEDQNITPEDGHVLSTVIVKGDEDLTPENIKTGVNIFDINGTFTEDADATEDDIIIGKTAYVKGEKITGTVPDVYNIIYVINIQNEITYKQQVVTGESFSIISDVPLSEYYEFKGWALEPATSIPKYQPNQLVTDLNGQRSDSIVLYAVLEEKVMNETISLTIDFDEEHEYTDEDTGEICGKKLEDEDSVTGIITVHDGNFSSGYSGIEKTAECEDVTITNACYDETNNSYKIEAKFPEIGIYPFTVTHKFKEQIVTSTLVIKIVNESGSMVGEGQMRFETNHSWYDSNWIPTNKIKGCYVSKYKYSFTSNDGHHSNHDSMAVFGKKTDGTSILLYDLFDESHVGEEVELSILNNIMSVSTSTHAINVGDFDLGKGDTNTPVGEKVSEKTFDIDDDIRQVRFFTYSDHPQNCFSSAKIDYNVEYKFDMDLYINDGDDSGETSINSYNIAYVINRENQSAIGQRVRTGKSFNITNYIPTISNSNFQGWSYSPSATSVDFTSGQKIDTDLADDGELLFLYATFSQHTHSYTYSIISPATCTEDGQRIGRCSCGDTIEETISSYGGHSWDSGTVTTQPTTTSKGIRTYHCTNPGCTEIKTEFIDALPKTIYLYSAELEIKDVVSTPVNISDIISYTAADGTDLLTKFSGKISVSSEKVNDGTAREWGAVRVTVTINDSSCQGSTITTKSCIKSEVSSVTSYAKNRLTLAWNTPSTNRTDANSTIKWYVYRYDGDVSSNYDSYTKIAEMPFTAGGYSDSNLVSGKKYLYYIRAYDTTHNAIGPIVGAKSGTPR